MEKNYQNDFAYVTCGDLGYMGLIEQLVISLLNTSTRKVIVYAVNCKIPFDYPNLIKRERTDFPIKISHDRWFWKQLSCIDSIQEGDFDNFVWIDGDMFCNNNIDSISEHFSRIENYPISNVHVSEDMIYYDNGDVQYFNERLTREYKVPRKVTERFLHICLYVYNRRCTWFFDEILSTYSEVLERKKYEELCRWNDEGIHNMVQSKYGFTNTLPMSDFSLGIFGGNSYSNDRSVMQYFYSYWNKPSPDNFGNPEGSRYVPENKDQILCFHENKNAGIASECIQFVKLKKNGFHNSNYFFVTPTQINCFEQKLLNNDLDAKYTECLKFEYKEICYIKPNDVIVDVGAGIGLFERYSRLKLASKVICFEPEKSKFDLLKLNAAPESILINEEVIRANGSNRVNQLFEDNTITKIDHLKVDCPMKEFDIMQSLKNFDKISRISLKYYNVLHNYDANLRSSLISSIMSNGYNSMLHMNGPIDYIHFFK